MRGRSRHLDGTGLTSMLFHQSQRSFIKSIQQGTVSIADGAASGTATITAVTTGSSVLFLQRESTAATSEVRSNNFVRIVLTDATTITANRIGTSGLRVIGFVIVEFWPGVVKSVQRGTISLADGTQTTNTATITAVNIAKAWVMSLGFSTDSGSSSEIAGLFTRVALTNATTVTATRGSSTSVVVTSYEVVEFY